MASALSSVVTSAVIRRRLPLVGAFCVISLGFSNLCPSFPTSSLKTGCAQSLPFAPYLRSKFSTQSVYAAKMEGSSSTVPSIVVYVTVPNREAGYGYGFKLMVNTVQRSKTLGILNLEVMNWPENRKTWLITISLAVCKAFDLLDMLKKEKEMLSAIKERQLKAKVSCEVYVNTKNQTVVRQDCSPAVHVQDMLDRFNDFDL